MSEQIPSDCSDCFGSGVGLTEKRVPSGITPEELDLVVSHLSDTPLVCEVCDGHGVFSSKKRGPYKDAHGAQLARDRGTASHCYGCRSTGKQWIAHHQNQCGTCHGTGAVMQHFDPGLEWVIPQEVSTESPVPTQFLGAWVVCLKIIQLECNQISFGYYSSTVFESEPEMVTTNARTSILDWASDMPIKTILTWNGRKLHDSLLVTTYGNAPTDKYKVVPGTIIITD